MSDLLTLYQECRRRGLNVIGLDGWTDWQQGYWFRREREWSGIGSRSNPPTFFMNHHTATEAYTSNVKNSRDQSKANIWLGLDLGNTGSGRMYENGDGVARADFAARWAANYGNGACDRTVYERYVWRDLVAPNQPSGSDDGYANKLGIGMEIIHRGTGQPCHPSVWELAAQINSAAMDVYGWDIARILDHRSSTRRKQDLNFAQKQDRYTINALRSRIAEIHGGGPPPEPEEDEMPDLPRALGDGGPAAPQWQSVIGEMQRDLNILSTTMPNDVVAVDGVYGHRTADALLVVLGRYAEDDGKRYTGQMKSRLRQKLRHADSGTDPPSSGLPDHTHTPGGVA